MWYSATISAELTGWLISSNFALMTPPPGGPATSDQQNPLSALLLDRYLHWLSSRGVHVCKLEIHVIVLFGFTKAMPMDREHLLTMPTVGLPIPSIEGQYIHGSLQYGNFPNVLEYILCLLDRLTGVKHLTGWSNIIADQQLEALVHKLNDQLEGLDLSNCCPLSPAAVTAAAWLLGKRLKLLKCSGLGTEHCASIAQNCQNLSHLTLSSLKLTSFAVLIDLCASGTLTDLTFSILLPVDIVCRIITSCPKMVRFTYQGTLVLSDEAQLITLACNHCPDIEIITLTAFKVRFVKDSYSNGKTAEVACSVRTDVSNAPLLNEMSVPISKYELSGVCVPFDGTDHVFDGLADFGSSLKSLTLNISLHNSPRYVVVEKDRVINVVRQCPQLQHVKIRGMHLGADFAVELLSILPSACPHVRSIKIVVGVDGVGPNEVDLAAFVNGFRALPSNIVEEISLVWNAIISEADLRAIAEVFPRLIHFGNLGEHVNNPVLLDLIVSGKLKAKVIKLDLHRSMPLVWGLMYNSVLHKISVFDDGYGLRLGNF